MRLAVVALALVLCSCATRTKEDKIFFQKGITVTLRSQERGGKTVDRGFAQPATISPQRLAIILTAIEVRDDRLKKSQRQQKGAFASDLIPELADALVLAFAKANNGQEIVVQAVRKQAHLKLFNEKYLTSFVTYIQSDRIFFHLSRIEWEIPKKRGDRDKNELPVPRIGDHVMDFSTLTSLGVEKVGKQASAVAWRDPLFRKPLPVKGSGRQRVRTILEESPIPADELPSAETEGLSPEKLRALADLEEARAAGKITEGEYLRQRKALLGY